MSIQQKVLGHLRGRQRKRLSLRMTPMIDVIFLLLTFFILTARFRTPEEFLPIMLPTATDKTESGVIEPLTVRLISMENGFVAEIGTTESATDITVNDSMLEQDLVEFTRILAKVLGEQKRTASDPIELRCDETLKWDYLVKVYNILYAMGVSDITFSMTD